MERRREGEERKREGRSGEKEGGKEWRERGEKGVERKWREGVERGRGREWRERRRGGRDQERYIADISAWIMKLFPCTAGLSNPQEISVRLAFLKISLQKFGNYRNLKKFKLFNYKTDTNAVFVDTSPIHIGSARVPTTFTSGICVHVAKFV